MTQMMVSKADIKPLLSQRIKLNDSLLAYRIEPSVTAFNEAIFGMDALISGVERL
ncbi:hypothetical protein BH09BAC4_BH09BAC4_47610 [soil metagenome]